MNDDFDVERALRAGLAASARHAPNGDALAERIIAAADQPRRAPDPGRPRRWRSWTLPLVAAGSVAAVVAAIVGAAQLHHTSAHPADTPSPGLTTATAPTSAQTSAPNTGAPSTSATSTAQGPSTGPVPASFHVADLTFVGASTGFALGSGQCLSGAGSQCTALLRTDDAGQNWVSIPNPPANVDLSGNACQAPCVSHIRFADERTGYAFGTSALFMTSDGGQHWASQPGGAIALEVAHGTVLRLLGDGRTLQRSDAGTDVWRDVALPGGATASSQLQRALDNAYVTGGVGGSTVTRLYASPDDGTTWLDRANPCARATTARQLDVADIAVGADGSVTLLCADHQGGIGAIAPFLITSGDAGATFGPAAPTPEPQLAPGLMTIGAADSGALFFAADALYRSTDHGAHWQRVATDATTGSAGGKGNFLGFETPKTGRWVTGDGSTVWTTTDGGGTWSPHTFR